MIFGTFFKPFPREFWGLQSESDKPFAVKHGTEHRFKGYKTLESAALGKKPGETIFQYYNGGWQEILFVSYREPSS
jgi:hypothetical protein